jgi:hypothetical protein
VAHYLFNFTKKGANQSKTLRDQAAQLLHAKLWGIGDKTANRSLLTVGDHVLVYVGAPEKAFVGHGTLSSGVHAWSSEEAAIYPENWPAGVSFDDAEVWEHPVALAAVWSKTPSSASNPDGRFFGGVVRIKKEDYETILAERSGENAQVEVEPAPTDDGVVAPSTPGTTADKLYAATEHLRKFLAQGVQPLSEDATRALFINKYLDALGYTDFGDVEYGMLVESGDFADYVLRVHGRAELVLAAKKLGFFLGPKEAAQVVKYASVLGVRWGAVSDGRYLKVYDPRVPHVKAEDRLVFEVDLAGYKDREDFDVRIYPDLELLSKESMVAGDGLERRAAQEAVRELLTTPGSKTVSALRDELKNKKLIHLGENELAEVLSELLG